MIEGGGGGREGVRIHELSKGCGSRNWHRHKMTGFWRKKVFVFVAAWETRLYIHDQMDYICSEDTEK